MDVRVHRQTVYALVTLVVFDWGGSDVASPSSLTA